jgi:hypothetical protein
MVAMPFVLFGGLTALIVRQVRRNPAERVDTDAEV